MELLPELHPLVQVNIQGDEEGLQSAESHQSVGLHGIEAILPEGFDQVPDIDKVNWITIKIKININ